MTNDDKGYVIQLETYLLQITTLRISLNKC